MYTLAIVKAVTFSMAPERSAKKLCNTEPSVVGLQTFEDRATVMSMIVTMSLCALWGMPPGKAVAWGWAPYFCAWSVRTYVEPGTLHLDLAPYDHTMIAYVSGRYQDARCHHESVLSVDESVLSVIARPGVGIWLGPLPLCVWSVEPALNLGYSKLRPHAV